MGRLETLVDTLHGQVGQPTGACRWSDGLHLDRFYGDFIKISNGYVDE